MNANINAQNNPKIRINVITAKLNVNGILENIKFQQIGNNL